MQNHGNLFCKSCSGGPGFFKWFGFNIFFSKNNFPVFQM